jgi:hypothetical protein
MSHEDFLMTQVEGTGRFLALLQEIMLRVNFSDKLKCANFSEDSVYNIALYI